MYLWKYDGAPESRKKKYSRRLLFVSCIFLVFLLLSVIVSYQSQQDGAAASGLTVIMSSKAMSMHGDFAPRELHITVGQTVIWINQATKRHSVTADDNSFNSGLVESGATYSHTFLQPGRYPYHCVLHGSELGTGMAGIIIVTAASSSK